MSIALIRSLNAAARQRGATPHIPQFDNIATQAQYRTAYDVAARYVRPGDQVLDWGCGNGHFSLYLETLGARITGYSFEPRPAVMANAPQFTFVPGTDGDPRALPFPNASFDAVVGVGVLEHVWELGGDERASLAELARVTKPGGTMLTFHLPNQSGWVEKAVGALKLNKHFHKRKYEAGEIRVLWADAGFDVVSLGLYNALPRAELRLLPGIVKNSAAFTALYDLADASISRIAPRACTNFYVVGRRRSS